MKSYDIAWQNCDEDKITISKNFFEHLLNCLANQKFVGELPSCGDGLAENPDKVKNIQKEAQDAIDKAWREGMFILSLSYRKEVEYKKLIEKLNAFYLESKDRLESDFESDLKEYSSDNNISFKWTQLRDQEIIMWMLLGCGEDAKIDCENEKFEVGQVSPNDFIYIIERRGFSPRLTAYIRDTLKAIGIGNNL